MLSSVELVLELVPGDGVEGPSAAELDVSGGFATEPIPSC